MTFTIEPMITLGTYQHDMWADGWTVVTKDRQVDGPVRAHGGRDRHRLRDPHPAVSQAAAASPSTTTATSPEAGCAPAVFGAMDGLVSNIAPDRRRRRWRRARPRPSSITGYGRPGRRRDLDGPGRVHLGADPDRAGRRRGREGAPRARAQSRGRDRGARPGLDRPWAAGRPGPRRWPRSCTPTREEALRVHAQEELGVDPTEQPSPWTAAISSFVCFAVGALIPLLPYLLGAAGALARAGLPAGSACSSPARWWPGSPVVGGGSAALRQLLLGARGGRRHVPHRPAHRRRHAHLTAPRPPSRRRAPRAPRALAPRSRPVALIKAESR